MRTSARGLHLIEGFEGFSSVIYHDSVGVATIGYGTTGADVSPLPSHLTQSQAQALLAMKLNEKYEPAVNRVGVPLNQNQFDALVSLAYNLGPGVMGPGYTIYADLKARNYAGASADFMHYTHAGGQVLQGLVNRRAAERKLFDTPWVAPNDPHYGRFASAFYTVGSRKIQERAQVELFDRLVKHPIIHWRALHNLRRDLAFLRDRITYVVRHIDPEHRLNVEWRRWRRDELSKRAGSAKAATA